MKRPSIGNGSYQPHLVLAANLGLLASLVATPAFAQQAAPANRARMDLVIITQPQKTAPPPVVLSQPAASASAPAAPPPPPPAAAPAPAPAPTSAPAPAAKPAAAPSDTKPVAPLVPGAATSGELPNLPMEAETDITDTREDPNRKYYFIGFRYRGTVIPQFLENIFVDDGATVYSNNIAIEMDIRQGGNSLIPWIQYSDYNTGDILYLQKGQPDWAANRSIVNSSLKAIYLGLDELWSIPVVPTKLDFELGFGVGIGGIFGTLSNNWVYQDDTNGELPSTNGHRYSKCPSTATPAGLATGDATTNGCNPPNHTTQNPAKVFSNGHFYVEPNWFNGGSVPVVFPHISVPELGLRFKPIKQLVFRINTGFGLTGFWFGAGIDYGLEKAAAPETKTGLQTRLHDTM